MSASDLEQIAERLDARDREYVSGLDPEQRDVVLSTMGRYMRSRGVAIGDPVPQLELVRADDVSAVRLSDLLEGKPALLIFGSYT